MKTKYLAIVLIVLSISLTVYSLARTTPFVDRTECYGCGDCVRECPTGAITLVNGSAWIDEDKCIDCLFCVKTCTYRAIRRAK